MLDRAFFRQLGIDVVKKYRQHIFDGGKDVTGKKFKPYTSAYGKAKRAGKLFKQDAASRSSRGPWVVGDLRNDLGFHNVKKTGVQIGWTKEGGKIGYLTKLNRKVTTPRQPLPKGIIRYIMKEARKTVKKKIKKKFPDGKVIRLPIGRK